MSDYVIETDHLTKKYNSQVSVDSLNLHVPKGKIYGLLGRNGAGKTTTMKLLLNLVKPTSGTITLFGEEASERTQKTYYRIGSIIENPGFYENLTASENLEILAKLRGQCGKDTVRNALSVVGLEGKSNKIFKDYSLGMKQRLGIAAAIMHEPELLILDEPINGLDPIGIYEIRNYLLQLCREKGTTIFISSHVLGEIEQIADIIGVMQDGRLIEETNMNMLHRQNRKYVEFMVSDANTAAMILEHNFKISDYTITENHLLRIFGAIDSRADFNRSFVENGILVSNINVYEEKLEDYFKNLTGGVGIE